MCAVHSLQVKALAAKPVSSSNGVARRHSTPYITLVHQLHSLPFVSIIVRRRVGTWLLQLGFRVYHTVEMCHIHWHCTEAPNH